MWMGAGALVIAAAFTAFARSRRIERTQARAVLAGLRQRLSQLDDPVKAAEKLRKEKAKLDTVEAKRADAYPKDQDTLTARYHGELKEAERRKASKQRDLSKKIDGFSEDLRKALSKALSDKQTAFVRDRLGRRLIAQSPPHGIGPKLTASLAAAGIRTAADFTGYRAVQNNSYSNIGAVLVLSNGGYVNVPGIGETKAIALEVWRNDLVNSAIARQPSALSAAERKPIEQDNTRRRAQLTDQRKALESATESLCDQARKNLEDGRSRLAREHTLAGERAGLKRQEFSRRTVALQQDSTLHGTLCDSMDVARLRRRRLSYARYLRFLYIGR